ncbi:MAG: hypothetical protein IJB59_07150 [Oscillospiraceae bacterium]|nr:hypothetical protein [Oscillospiraceae bacterium]
MYRSFFPATGTWLKGNIHSHTTQTDGLCPPDQQIRDYCAQNYDFFSITDHNMVVNAKAFAGDTNILLIPGWERDVRHHEKNTKCIHVVGLFPSEEGLFSSDPDFQPRKERKYEVCEISNQQLVDEMVAEGQFTVLAHPQWSRMTPDEVLDLKGYHAIEVFNTGCERLMHAGRADLYWDLLLESGRKVWGIACDDTHGKTAKSDRFGGWIMVRSEERTASSILEAMQKGEYYLSQGPEIQDWGREENVIYFRCSPCKEIHVTTYPTRGGSYYAEEGQTLTEIAYSLKGGEKYIRIECIDESGNTAWTNPYFF